MRCWMVGRALKVRVHGGGVGYGRCWRRSWLIFCVCVVFFRETSAAEIIALANIHVTKKKTKTKTTATLCFRGSVFASFFFFLATRACRDNRALQNTLGTKKKKNGMNDNAFLWRLTFFFFRSLFWPFNNQPLAETTAHTKHHPSSFLACFLPTLSVVCRFCRHHWSRARAGIEVVCPFV